MLSQSGACWGKLRVNIESSIEKAFSYSLLSVDGVILQDGSFIVGANELSTENLSIGMYVLKIKESEGELIHILRVSILE